MQQFSYLVKASQEKLIGGVIKVQNQRYVLDKYLCCQGNMFGSSSYQFFKYLLKTRASVSVGFQT